MDRQACIPDTHFICMLVYKWVYTVDSKIIRALETSRVKKLISNAIL